MNRNIVTLTMNPAVDVCAAIDRIVPVHKLRCGLVRRDAGGGGINVARAARRFGDHPLAVFPAGGPIGQLLEHLVAAEGVDYVSVPISGDTREDFTVDETSSGAQFRFVLPGPSLSDAEQGECLQTLKAKLTPGGFLVASGSLPPGVSPEFYASVAKCAEAAGVKFVLDSSGAALKAALGCGVYLIKPSLREFEELVGRTLADEAARVEAARELIHGRQCDYVALSLGAGGALLIGAAIAFAAAAPNVTVVSTVGAGDSFLAALVSSLARGKDERRALIWAVAAGSAALLSPGTDLCHLADCERLARDVAVRVI